MPFVDASYSSPKVLWLLPFLIIVSSSGSHYNPFWNSYFHRGRYTTSLPFQVCPWMKLNALCGVIYSVLQPQLSHDRELCFPCRFLSRQPLGQIYTKHIAMRVILTPSKSGYRCELRPAGRQQGVGSVHSSFSSSASVSTPLMVQNGSGLYRAAGR
jgi:hypothetical protein